MIRKRDARHGELASCRSRAKEVLARRHPEEFREIYDEEVKKAGIIRQFKVVRISDG